MEKKHIYIDGEIGKTITLAKVRASLPQSFKGEVLVSINSSGGYVEEGFAIYNYLKTFDNLTTQIIGKCYSIASLIFLAGKERLVSNGNLFMIHNPNNQSNGDAKQHLQNAQYLDKIKGQLVGVYNLHTGIAKDKLITMMDEEKLYDPEDVQKLGFATKFTSNAKALFKTNNMSTYSNFINKAKSIFTTKTMNATNKYTTTDATGNEIIFPDVEDGMKPNIGDKAEMNGEAVEGEVTLAEGNLQYYFENGILVAIISEPSEKEPVENNGEGEGVATEPTPATAVNSTEPTGTEPTAEPQGSTELESIKKELQTALNSVKENITSLTNEIASIKKFTSSAPINNQPNINTTPKNKKRTFKFKAQ